MGFHLYFVFRVSKKQKKRKDRVLLGFAMKAMKRQEDECDMKGKRRVWGLGSRMRYLRV